MTKSTTNLAKAPKMYETENDISLQHRTELNALMNHRLVSAVDLQLQMKQAHWNVKGPSFIGLHELFDKVAEAVEGYVDQFAERICAARRRSRRNRAHGGIPHTAHRIFAGYFARH